MLPRLQLELLSELAAMLDTGNPYARIFYSLCGWALTYTPVISYRKVIHADRRPHGEHVSRYNGLEASQVSAIITGNEGGEIGTRDVVMRRRGVLNSNGNGVPDTIPVSHRL